MKRQGTTPPFRGPTGNVLPRSIAEVTYLRLGGLDQWVMIRGEDRDNPVLVLLHGGPGFSEVPLFRHFNADLEKSFTVVYWDQRGAGKSFHRKIPTSTMTTQQFVADLDELVDWVRAHLNKDRVAVLGHSWGTVLGAMYVAQFPAKVAAYVGAAQIGDWHAGEVASYGFALAEARRRNNRRALKALHTMGPPPHSASDLLKERTWIQRMEGRMGPTALCSMARIFLGGPERSLLDLPGIFRGFRFSLDAMWPDLSRLNLADHVSELKVPTFFFLGRNDHWVPPSFSLDYIDRLTAPSKEVIWFEQSGHEMFADEPSRFVSVMLDAVRPVVAQAAR